MHQERVRSVELSKIYFDYEALLTINLVPVRKKNLLTMFGIVFNAILP